MIPKTILFSFDRGSLFLLRHGRTVSDGVKRYIGQKDIPLSSSGIRQAEKWANWFLSYPIKRILCSDLKRSLNTAEIIGRRCNVLPEVFPDLREINLGQWEGLAFSDIEERFPDAFARRGRNLAVYHPPNGESFQDLQARVVPIFTTLLQQSHHNILFVGHAGVNRVLLCHLLQMPMQQIFSLGQDYAGLSIIERRNASCRLVLLNMILQPM